VECIHLGDDRRDARNGHVGQAHVDVAQLDDPQRRRGPAGDDDIVSDDDGLRDGFMDHDRNRNRGDHG